MRASTHYITRLNAVKNEIEYIEDAVVKGQHELKFIGKDGEPVKKYYEMVDESTGAIFRNILEDTLEDIRLEEWDKKKVLEIERYDITHYQDYDYLLREFCNGNTSFAEMKVPYIPLWSDLFDSSKQEARNCKKIF